MLKNITEDHKLLLERDKLISLQLSQQETDKRLGAFISRKEKIRNKTDYKAKALLKGEEIPAEDLEFNNQISEFRDKLKVLNRAIELQKDVVYQTESTISMEICEKVRPEYAKLVKRIVKAIFVLAEAGKAEFEFRSQLEDGGFHLSTLYPGALHIVNHYELSNSSNRFVYYLQSMIDYGYITPSDIPKSWQEKWNIKAKKINGAG